MVLQTGGCRTTIYIELPKTEFKMFKKRIWKATLLQLWSGTVFRGYIDFILANEKLQRTHKNNWSWALGEGLSIMNDKPRKWNSTKTNSTHHS